MSFKDFWLTPLKKDRANETENQSIIKTWEYVPILRSLGSTISAPLLLMKEMDEKSIWILCCRYINASIWHIANKFGRPTH